MALTSLLDGAADELIAIDASGGLRDDLDLHELRQHLNANRLDSVRLRLPLGDVATRFTVTVRASDSLTSRSLSSRLVDAPAPKSPLWSGCYLA